MRERTEGNKRKERKMEEIPEKVKRKRKRKGREEGGKLQTGSERGRGNSE